MLSMTGYGKGEYKENGVELTCEIKTVNNRYLDIAVKSPRIFTAYDEVIRSTVREKMTRGHADIFVALKDKREKPQNLVPDLALASAYVTAAKKIKEQFPELEFDLTVSSVLRYPEVLKQEDSHSLDEELTSALDCALNIALDNLNAMRAVEGQKLKDDMLSRVVTIEKLVEEKVHIAFYFAPNSKVLSGLLSASADGKNRNCKVLITGKELIKIFVVNFCPGTYLFVNLLSRKT